MTIPTKTIVVTGASSGIGAAAARRLAGDGATVVIVGRDERRTNAIADELGADRHVVDFTRLDDVRALADKLNKLDRIDVLANNAGGMFSERLITEDGFEMTFQVNHLAGFVLTQALLPKLLESRGSVVNTSSAANFSGRIDLGNLQLTEGWTAWKAYANAKLANVLFTRGLHEHYVLEGLSSAAFHPGVVATAFGSSMGGFAGKLVAFPPVRRLMVTPEQGADTLVWLAQGTPPRDWASGKYYDKRRIKRPNKQAEDAALVEAFWERSAALAVS